MKLSYLDIHTHQRLHNEDVVRVDCLSAKELKGHTELPFMTAGIHPWWLEESSLEEIEKLKNHILELATGNRLWAIGETGIDRLYPEFLDQQIELFKWHIDLAHQYQLPLIIHSVRAGSDILKIIKEAKPETPWIFHDFRGNDVLARDILRLHPDSYFSFGLSLDNSPQIRELLPLLPLDHIFLETDAQKHLDIHDIYLRAAECLGIDIDLLKSQIWQNFKRIDKKILV